MLREGNLLLEKGDYAGALELYQAAHARFPSPKILLNLGATLRQLHRDAEALEAYEKFLREPNTDGQTRADVEKIVVDLRAALPPVLRVQVDPAGARVFVDDKLLGEAPIEQRLDAGPHALRAEKEGFLPASATVTLRPGEQQRLSLRLARVPEPSPRPPTPDSPIAAASRATLPDGGEARPEAALQASPREAPLRPPAWAPWVAAGVAAVAAGAGAYFSVKTLDENAGLDFRESAAKWATVAFVTAGAAAASGVGLWAWRFTTRDRPAAVGLRADGVLMGRVGF